MWNAAHRQLSSQSARQLARGQVGIKQSDLDAIVSPASPHHKTSAVISTVPGVSVEVADADKNQRSRYSELVAKILAGTATEAEQNEAEQIGARHPHKLLELLLSIWIVPTCALMLA